MTDTYNDTTGSRKKFLIPLVVLLLCAVSLTGAGYAYNSTVTVSDNTSDDKEFILEMQAENGAPVTAPIKFTENTFVLTNITNVAKNNAKSVEIVAEDFTGVTWTGKLVITTDITGDSFMITPAAIAPIEITATGATGTITLTPTIAMFTNEGCTESYVAGSEIANAGTVTIWFQVSVAATGSNTFANTANAEDCKDKVETAIGNAGFAIGFTAAKYSA